MEDAPRLDPTTLDALAELLGPAAPATIRRLLQTLREQSEEKLTEAREAIVLGDCSSLTRAAHVLKGGYRQVGAKRAGDLAAEVESAARLGDLSSARVAMERLVLEFAALDPVLEKLLSPAGSTTS